jgi:hypothetical protein
MVVAGEPEFVDQVPRRQAYEAAHPEVQITYHGPYWRAVVNEQDGRTVISRYELKDLLDKLEALDRSGRPLNRQATES